MIVSRGFFMNDREIGLFIIFTFYVHIHFFILSSEPVQTDTTRSSLISVFFLQTRLFLMFISRKKFIKKIPTSHLTHVCHTCGCTVNLPHNHTYREVSLDREPKQVSFINILKDVYIM
jgi:hypothetical protein